MKRALGIVCVLTPLVCLAQAPQGTLAAGCRSRTGCASRKGRADTNHTSNSQLRSEPHLDQTWRFLRAVLGNGGWHTRHRQWHWHYSSPRNNQGHAESHNDIYPHERGCEAITDRNGCRNNSCRACCGRCVSGVQADRAHRRQAGFFRDVRLTMAVAEREAPTLRRHRHRPTPIFPLSPP